MNKYIDAEKLIAEIKRQQRNLVALSNTEQVCVRRDCAIQNGAYNYILSVITSLQQEQTEVDLEKEIENYAKSYNENGINLWDWEHTDNAYSDMIRGLARHCYELGRAKKEE